MWLPLARVISSFTLKAFTGFGIETAETCRRSHTSGTIFVNLFSRLVVTFHDEDRFVPRASARDGVSPPCSLRLDFQPQMTVTSKRT